MTLLPFAALWVAYNQARWGVPYDIGYTELSDAGPGDARLPANMSAFGWCYLPYDIYAFFLRPPIPVEWKHIAHAPYFNVPDDGIALTWTSPALVLAFLAPCGRLRTLLWAACVLTAAPSFLYFLDGIYQFGMRHALDFEPFLFALMALGVRTGMPRWGAVLCGYSMLVGAWGCWWWNVFVRMNG